jgi:hypothetical protein
MLAAVREPIRPHFPRTADDEIRIMTIGQILQEKITEPSVTSNRLQNNFAGAVTSVLGPDVACEPSVGRRCCRHRKILCVSSVQTELNDLRSQPLKGLAPFESLNITDV